MLQLHIGLAARCCLSVDYSYLIDTIPTLPLNAVVRLSASLQLVQRRLGVQRLPVQDVHAGQVKGLCAFERFGRDASLESEGFWGSLGRALGCLGRALHSLLLCFCGLRCLWSGLGFRSLWDALDGL